MEKSAFSTLEKIFLIIVSFIPFLNGMTFVYMVSKEFFIRENKTAHNAVTTPHCRKKCSGCGVNKAVGRECFC